MNTKFILGTTLAVGATVALAAAKDPVLMTVGGIDVPMSEFEYLYTKNSQQQIQPQTLEEYLDRFKVYRMKVADAKAAGIDTTAAFRSEYERYKSDLAQPYLTDSAYMLQLAREQYGFNKEERKVRHIMKFKAGPNASVQGRRQLDSLRNLLVAGADFEQIARANSDDRSVAENGGSLGIIAPDRLPYDFVKAAYSLKPGEISQVVETPQTLHLILVDEVKPSRGQLHVSYILKQGDASAKATLDSIYNVIQSGAESFEKMALQYSDDKRAGQNGGFINSWLGAAQMPPAMAEAAFALQPEEVSRPVETNIGWMLVKRINSRALPSFEEEKDAMLQAVNNPRDSRYLMVMDDASARMAKKLKGKLNGANIAKVREYIGANGIDEALYAEAASASAPELFTIGKQAFTSASVLDRFMGNPIANPEMALYNFDIALKTAYNNELSKASEEALYLSEPDYRNLLNEFHDGSLVYEIASQKVYNKALKDTEGLERYFRDHKSDYRWTSPRVKGYLVQATNDSVGNLVRARIETLAPDTLVRTIRKEFGKDVQIDRVLKAKGDDPMIDALVFGAADAQPRDSRFATCFIYDARLLNEPEAVEDVRGIVTNDYQNQLERDWVDELREKYPVKVNPGLLKKLK